MPATQTETWTIECVTHFITERHPEEAFLIPSVPQLVRALAEPGMGEASAPGGLPFDQNQPSTLAAPFAIMTVWSVLTELQLAGSLPSEGQIQRAIVRAADVFGASNKLAAELGASLTPKLLALFSGTPTPVPMAGPGQVLRVDWCDRRVEPYEAVGAASDLYPVPEVETRFRCRTGFVLRVDESNSVILVGDDPQNRWGIRRRPRRLLYLVLRMFRTGVLPYKQIDELVLGTSTTDPGPPRSRALRELYKAIDCGLERVIRVRPKEEQYERAGLIPYYWARFEGEKSRLLGSDA